VAVMIRAGFGRNLHRGQQETSGSETHHPNGQSASERVVLNSHSGSLRSAEQSAPADLVRKLRPHGHVNNPLRDLWFEHQCWQEAWAGCFRTQQNELVVDFDFNNIDH
jgi:hypothetical protein